MSCVAGRKSLERLLPHYLSGLQANRQAMRPGEKPSWLPAASTASDAKTGVLAGPRGGRPAAPVPQQAAAPAPPQLGGRLPGGPPPARASMHPSFMNRPSFAVNGLSGQPQVPEDQRSVRRSTFWARGKTTPTQTYMPPVRRSRTLDLGRRNGGGGNMARGYGVGSAAYGAPKPRSSRVGPHDDITVARSSREVSPPRGEDLSKDGMWEFETMMARRVAMFGRPSVADSQRPNLG